jgi:aminoglycoside/choline kinase family phosphotransferase
VISTQNQQADARRLASLRAWLCDVTGIADVELKPASSDASFRRYFRVQLDGKTGIVMDAPPPQEDCRPFVEIAGFLQEMGLNGPQVLHADLERGFLLISDLGQRQYLEQLSADPESVDRLYQEAISALATLQNKGVAFHDKLPAYDEPLLSFEMSLFHDWLCERHLGLVFSKEEERQWSDCCKAVVLSALEQPSVFVHRDYHSRNLMLTDENNPGILDFQDAVVGPLTYDLVSLLKDCYVRWPEDRVQGWAMSFYEALAQNIRTKIDGEAFLRFFHLMGVQRHLKAAGIFARLLHRDGKPGYLKDVPRTLRYIVDVGRRYPEVRFLGKLIEERCLPALEGKA